MKKIGICFVCIFSLSVYAQESVKAWSGESELSIVKNSGNTVSESILAKQSLVYDVRPWRNTLKIEASNVSSEVVNPTTGNSDNVRTGEKYYLTEQLDRFITEKSYAFIRGSYEKDRFSGFDNRSTAVAGYGRTLVDNDKVDLKAEIGFGRNIEELDECDTATCLPTIAYGETVGSKLWYFSEGFVWRVSKPAEIGQDLSLEDTDEQRIGRFHMYIKSQFFSNFATKMAYTMKYTDVVPAEKNHKDEEITLSLVYSF